MKIFIIDYHVLFREGLVSLLSQQPDVVVVGESDAAEDAIPTIKQLAPDYVLIDINLRHADGYRLIKLIQDACPASRVVVLTMNESEEQLLNCVRHGAKGYLPKTISITKLMASLRALQRGEVAIPRLFVSRIVEEYNRLSVTTDKKSDVISHLTSREVEVLRELAMGAKNREIAERLYITENTVKVHIHNILEKLDLPNRREAENYARRNGLASLTQ